MSDKRTQHVAAGIETKPGTESTIAAGTGESRMPHIPEELSILPVRGFVIFPGTILPLNIQRAASIKLLDETLPRTKSSGCSRSAMRRRKIRRRRTFITVGTAAIVLKLLRQADDHVMVIVQGLRRFSFRKIVATTPFLRAEIDLLESIMPAPSKEWEADIPKFARFGREIVRTVAGRAGTGAPDVLSIEDPEQLADFLAPNLNVDVAQKQAMLEELDVEKRVRAVQTRSPRSSRSRRSSRSCRRMCSRNFPMRNGAPICARKSKRSSRNWAKAKAAREEQIASNCAPGSRKRSRRRK